ncbi:hypothetical protein OIU76_019087 [Salix suchowensis]|nr:hypothetical protein OIU76_019087 [Salix suchowensis]
MRIERVISDLLIDYWKNKRKKKSYERNKTNEPSQSPFSAEWQTTTSNLFHYPSTHQNNFFLVIHRWLCSVPCVVSLEGEQDFWRAIFFSF